MLRSIFAAATAAALLFGHAPDVPISGPNVPLPKPAAGQSVAGRPFNTWPLCRTETSRNCRWDARLQGNGHGRSFVNAGKRVYVKLAAVPARGTLAYFPQCAKPTFTGAICWYSANTRGDGLGRDYYFTTGGVKRYLPYQMIES